MEKAIPSCAADIKNPLQQLEIDLAQKNLNAMPI